MGTMSAEQWFEGMLAKFENDPEFMAEESVLEIINSFQKAVEAEGLTRQELAERVGTSPSFVSEVLNGKPNMSLLTVCRFAAALGLDVEITLTPRRRG